MTGLVDVYLDGFTPIVTVDNVTKTNAGDDANLGIGIGQGEITAVAEFHSNCIIVAAVEMLAHLLCTRPRDMGSTQKNDLRTIFAGDNACGVVLLDSH